jgi:hypothetical protein
MECLFELPIEKDDGAILTHEDVVAGLNRDTLSQINSLGLSYDVMRNISKKYSDSLTRNRLFRRAVPLRRVFPGPALFFF